jgi:DNA-binding NarL/FixJ family response regulator
MKYSVAIVDDHILFAQALQTLVNTFDSFTVLSHARNGEEFLHFLKNDSLQPDIALMDINMPVMNGIETMQWVSKNKPDLKVLALSMDDDEDTIIKMLRAGAKGYLLKDINPGVLEEALKEVATKGFFYSDRITNTVLKSLHQTGEHSPQHLKDREIEFLKLVCTEKTYKEIAGEMILSPKTIDGYREALFEKLQVRSRVGLVLYAIKNKLFKVE